MTSWNYAEVLEVVADTIPDAPCVVQGDKVVRWSEFERRANALAAHMLEAGLGHQAKVAAYTTNCPEYLETYIAAFKAGLVPVNTNFRYASPELLYLFDNADAEAIVFHSSFSERIEPIRERLPRVRCWLAVDDGAPIPDWATGYEDVVAPGANRVIPPWGRSPDDLLLLYTGGTTGMPKGVMWRQDDLFNVLGCGGHPIYQIDPISSLDDLRERSDGKGPPVIPACPLMHGTGQTNALLAMALGGSTVLLTSRGFDAAELWRTVERRSVYSAAIVGDAFARPMLAELDANPGRHDLSSLSVIVSSGVMWSQEVKAGLLRHLPHTLLFDAFGSSEAIGLGASISTGGTAEATAQFELGPGVRVFDDDGSPVEPGSGIRGRVAVPGFVPQGYYKDPEKTANTFIEYEGVRYAMPGDYALVSEDDTLVLLGRGSVCINSGGEKIFPEEVEEVLKRHPAVVDAVCVGVPDERFGESVCGVIETCVDGIDAAAIRGFVGEQIAAYKAPRHLVEVDSIGRAPNGKADYAAARELAVRRLGLA